MTHFGRDLRAKCVVYFLGRLLATCMTAQNQAFALTSSPRVKYRGIQGIGLYYNTGVEPRFHLAAGL